MIETIHWIDVALDQPDEGMLVLVKTPSPSEPVWFGYLENEEWFTPDNQPYAYKVTHWAEMPEGPDE